MVPKIPILSQRSKFCLCSDFSRQAPNPKSCIAAPDDDYEGNDDDDGDDDNNNDDEDDDDECEGEDGGDDDDDTLCQGRHQAWALDHNGEVYSRRSENHPTSSYNSWEYV